MTLADLLMGVAVVLAVEGLAYAVAPAAMQRALTSLAAAPPERLRLLAAGRHHRRGDRLGAQEGLTARALANPWRPVTLRSMVGASPDRGRVASRPLDRPT